MAALTEQAPAIACSFCLKTAGEVDKMVAGPGVFICNECVALCVQIIESVPAGKPSRVGWEKQATDESLLDTLPKIASIGGQVERQLALWVGEARSRGVTWTRIGAALGMTRQSAWERFSGEE